jgi:peptidoglycan hydrolase FlgJ
MISATAAAGVSPVTDDAEKARLRKAAAGMEAVFLEQLLKAMRETVPQDGALDSSAGEEMFTGMLDTHLSGVAAARQNRGLGEALYRQLARMLEVSRTPGTGETK